MCDACYSKTPIPTGVPVLMVKTEPVSGQIFVDGLLVACGYYAAPIEPGPHLIGFGSVCHPCLAGGDSYVPSSEESIQVDADSDAYVVGVYTVDEPATQSSSGSGSAIMPDEDD